MAARWEWIALGYVSYLAVVALTRSEFARARRPVLLALGVGWAWLAVRALPGPFGVHPGVVLEVVLPALVLLVSYRLSGLFFVRPNVCLERWLSTVDRRLLAQPGWLDRFRASPRVVQESIELSYLLVYLIVPGGAATLALTGHADELGPFWATVLLAELACYGMLPWLQTRPPRALEPIAQPESSVLLLRRLNLNVLSRGSIQVNTVPSGHAAGAVAAALAVASVMPVVGAPFLGLAASIVVATVLGRYHYAVDSVLGVLVAVAVWSVV